MHYTGNLNPLLAKVAKLSMPIHSHIEYNWDECSYIEWDKYFPEMNTAVRLLKDEVSSAMSGAFQQSAD